MITILFTTMTIVTIIYFILSSRFTQFISKSLDFLLKKNRMNNQEIDADRNQKEREIK